MTTGRTSVITVSQLNKYVKSLLSESPVLSGLMVRGEISNFTRHLKSGHLYFTLKDETAAIKTVMFQGNARLLRFEPKNGMAVILSGSVSLYERDGSYQFYATDMQPDGIGALHLAFEQLRDRLEREGLFDKGRKRPLPQYPETVGIVTSEGAAALQDMLGILFRRFPGVRVVLYPAQVQGERAAGTLVKGLLALNAKRECDVIILGRGGGSIEDLWAFNDETLARTIAASRIPVVSAVGHETDFTIADFAADLRAPTPSAAAELVTPDREDVRYYLEDLLGRCEGSLQRKLERMEQRLRTLQARMATPAAVVLGCEQRLLFLEQKLRMCLEHRLRQEKDYLERLGERLEILGPGPRILRERERLARLAGLVEASSPIRLLERGYSLTRTTGAVVTSVSQVAVGDRIVTRVSDGEFHSIVESK